jgi:hypothetical protein
MAYEKSKKEKKAEDRGQRKINQVRDRGIKTAGSLAQGEEGKIASATGDKKQRLVNRARRLKKREDRLNQRFGQKAGNVGTSQAAGNYGNLDEVVVTAKRKPMGKPVNLNTGAKLTGYSLPGVGSREKNTESGFRNPEELKSRFN